MPSATLKQTKLFSLYLTLFIDAMGIGILLPLLSKTLIDPHAYALVSQATASERNILYGIILGIYFFTWFLGSAMLSELSDTAGRKKALLICMAGITIAYLITALAFVFHSIILIIIGRIIAGFTAGSQPIAQATIIDISPVNKLTRNIGLVVFYFTAGMIAGPIVGAFLSDHHLIYWFSNTTPFYCVTLFSALNFFIILFSFKETSTQNNKIRIHPKKAITIFISAFRHKKIRPLSIAFAITLMGFNSYYIYAPIFLLHRFAFSTTSIGVGLAMGSAMLPNWFERHHISVKKIIIGGNIILAIGIVLNNILVQLPLIWLIIIPMNAGFTLAYSFTINLFSKQVNSNEQGWVMGMSTSPK